jgi:hypothetical protein
MVQWTVSVCRWEERPATSQLVSSTDGVVAMETRRLGDATPRWRVVDAFPLEMTETAKPSEVARAAFAGAAEPDVGAIVVVYAMAPPYTYVREGVGLAWLNEPPRALHAGRWYAGTPVKQ